MAATETEAANLRDSLRPLLSRWWLVALIALIAAAGTYQHYRGKPSTYEASTNLYLAGDSALDSVLGGGGGGGEPDRDARNQAILLRTTPVAEEAAKRLKFDGDPRVLLPLIKVAPASDSDFLQVTGTSSSPKGAVDLANAFARAYIATRTQEGKRSAGNALRAARERLDRIPRTADTAAERGSLQDQIQRLELAQSVDASGIRQVEPAISATAISSNPRKGALFALALGALLGIMLVYAFEFFDRRVKRVDELGPLYGHSVLAGIPRAPRAAQAADVSKGLQPPLTEAFRALRTSLQLKATGSSRANGRPLRTILVTSAVPQEGKSTVARNLALAFHEAGLKVAVVDADLRRPQVARGFGRGSEPGPGLTEVLAGEIDVSEALHHIDVDVAGRETMMRVRERAQQDVTEGGRLGGSLAAGSVASLERSFSESSSGGDLAILPSGRTPADPAAVLTAGALSGLLDHLARECDIVIVDTAPLLAVSDAVPLLAAVDGVLLVSRVNLTTTTDIAHLNDLLDRVPNVDVLGVIANDVRESSGAYAYAQRPARSRRRSKA